MQISTEGTTQVWTEKSSFRISPADFGLSEHPLSKVSGGKNATENAAIMRNLLDGNLVDGDPILDFVLMNSAALLVIAGKAESLIEGVRLARESIKTGNARRALEQYVRISQG